MMQDNLVSFLKSLGDEELKFILEKVGDKSAGASTPPSEPGNPAGDIHRGKIPDPAQTFEVANDVKYLDQVQLHALSENFRKWYSSTPGASRRRARGRMWLLFLLIRYGALKLGEALAIDDLRDFNLANCSVTVRGEHEREVQFPKEAWREIWRLLEDPMNASLRGEVFRLDPGFVRRKFYERADECQIPREMVNPSVIRHSRAVELLREGMPPKAVQSILGHQNANLTAQYVNFSDSDLKRLVNYYVLKETQVKTSARNSFTGKVTNIRTGNILAEVEVTTPSGLKVVSVITEDSMINLGIKPGVLVTATVKAPWVILVKEDMKLKTSARNKFAGKIIKVNVGQISAEVIVELPDATKVCALVTDESVKSLDLKVGDDIYALFKAFSVILNVE
jgi:molybdate transport system regulatory protein